MTSERELLTLPSGSQMPQSVLLKYFPSDVNLSSLSPSLRRKLVLWEMANEKLEEWGDADLPPYCPGPELWKVHLSESPQRLIGGGEAGGKTRGSVQELLGLCKPQGRYWLTGRQYENTHIEFDYLKRLMMAVGAITDEDKQVHIVRKESWSMELGPPFDGASVHTRTVDDVTKIVAWTLDGAVMCEAALCSKEAYTRLEARTVNRREGAWLLLAGTFEKTEGPWYATLFNAWRIDEAVGESFSVPSWANPVLYPGGRRDPKILALEAGDEDRFMERHAGIPVPPSTLVYRKFNPKIHTGWHPFRKWRPRDDEGDRQMWPVELAIDPGYANYAILALQRDKGSDGITRVHVVDEVWGNNRTTEQLIRECRVRDWWPNVRPGRAGVMDVAGKQHHGDRSVKEVWAAAGYRLRARHVKIEDGIDRVASFLEDMGLKHAESKDGEPEWTEPKDWSRLFVHRSCRHLIEEFTEYKYREGPVTGRRIPIDAYNHGLKALSYWLVDRFGYARRPRPRAPRFEMVA